MSDSSGPQTIHLVRHGEKLGDASSDKDGGPDLSVRGSARAAALPSLFTWTQALHGGENGTAPSCALTEQAGGFNASYPEVSGLSSLVPPRFAPPAFIFATSPDGTGGNSNDTTSHRPLETVTPLAAALGLTINDHYADKAFPGLATEITTNPMYDGRVVLVAWHHGNLPALAKALGAIDVPDPWPPTTFDWLWEIDYSTNPKHVIVHSQGLMYGDAAPS